MHVALASMAKRSFIWFLVRAWFLVGSMQKAADKCFSHWCFSPLLSLKTKKRGGGGHIHKRRLRKLQNYSIHYSPFDADEPGVNKLSGEKCCLLKLAAAGAPPRGAPGPYIWPPERFEAKFPKCVEEGVTEPYGESILTIPIMQKTIIVYNSYPTPGKTIKKNPKILRTTPKYIYTYIYTYIYLYTYILKNYKMT